MHQPDDQWTGEDLNRQMSELVILHWTKPLAVHSKVISQGVNLESYKNQCQQRKRYRQVMSSSTVEIHCSQKPDSKEAIEDE